jgi:hypothetical protein
VQRVHGIALEAEVRIIGDPAEPAEPAESAAAGSVAMTVEGAGGNAGVNGGRH